MKALRRDEIHAKRADWDMWEHGYPGGEDSAAVTVRCQRVVDICRAAHGDVALFAHGHILRSLAAVWLGLGADKVNRITCKKPELFACSCVSLRESALLFLRGRSAFLAMNMAPLIGK